MVESQLHLSLKEAVVKHLSEGNHCWFEDTMGAWGGAGSLRVDVFYVRKRRWVYVECETRPNIERLKKKGDKRNEHHKRTDYNLIVPSTEFVKRDWYELRGYFDKIYSYDVGLDEIVDHVDLRTLGGVQDFCLDFAMPIIRSREAKDLYWWLIRRKNGVCWRIRALIQCSSCKLGIDTPWKYCPRRGCPDSQPSEYQDRINWHFKSSNL